MGACVCVPSVKDGHHYWQWAGQALNECAYTDAEKAAIMLGLINILLWLVAQIPQLVQTYEEKQVEAISIGLFVLWLLGDITNLLGCLLTNAYTTQLYTAVYYCAIDVIMVSQYIYYKKIYPKRNQLQENTGKLTIIPVIAFLLVVGLQGTIVDFSTSVDTAPLAVGRELYTLVGHSGSNSTNGDVDKNECDFKETVEGAAKYMGIVCSWLSAICYLCSRIPQLVKNFKRKNVEGLSRSMFICSVTANTCYGLSIILNQPPMDEEFFTSKLPFIVGSMGTLVFDCIILIEYAVFKGNRSGYQAIE